MERAMDIGPCAATSRPVDLTEAGLVQRVRSGDAAAFRALVRLHQGAVLRLGLSMLKEESLAAELAQEVFLSFWKERARYRHDGRLKAYLLGIARNRALAELKRERSRARLADAARTRPVTPLPTPEIAAAEDQARESLRVALERLPADRREAVRLRFLHDLSVTEVAMLTQVPVGTAKSRIGRGLAALREVLSHER